MNDKVKTERIGLTQSKLLEKAKSLPLKPGCYLMRNKQNLVLYVGKAKALRNRVISYFQNGAKSPKTEILVSHIRDFDFILTESETEAFILENNLIKKHMPKYNILMRDDKSYPYISVDRNHPYPRFLYKRKIKKGKGIEVYGPFVHGSNISEVLRIVIKSFQLRDCTDREYSSRKEPCLLYQIHQCSAPCVDKISNEEYEIDMNLALNFFNGKGEVSINVLNDRMLKSAEREEFERAAIYRDHIEILRNFLESGIQENAEINGNDKNIDLISFYPGEIEVDLAIYMVRNGLLLGHKNFHFPTFDCEDDIEDKIINFLFQYYTSTFDPLPDLIVSDLSENGMTLFSDALQTLGKLEVRRPGRKYSSLYKLTSDQAFEHQRVRLSNEESVYVGLNKLKDLLNLKERPVVLECYDIAIFQGTSPTAAQIVFIEGRPEKKKYRHYHLKERIEGNNDFAMMKEVLSRRLRSEELPDIFIVDGGKGQVSVFQEVLREANINIPVVGIAKSKTVSRKNKTFKEEKLVKTEERLIVPGRLNPYYLNRNRSLLKIIIHMRDEAHRFSRRLHHKTENKRIIKSWVDDIKGVTEVTKKKILMNLDKSIDELVLLSPKEIEDLLDVSQKIAMKIVETLKKRTSCPD